MSNKANWGDSTWPKRPVVQVDVSPMNLKIMIAQLSCGHDVYLKCKPRVGARIRCCDCAEAADRCRSRSARPARPAPDAKETRDE
jgi:hypothetical protein